MIRYLIVYIFNFFDNLATIIYSIIGNFLGIQYIIIDGEKVPKCEIDMILWVINLCVTWVICGLLILSLICFVIYIFEELYIRIKR